MGVCICVCGWGWGLTCVCVYVCVCSFLRAKVCLCTFELMPLGEVWTCLFTLARGCPVGWGCSKLWMHLCRGVRPPPPNACLGYDTKQFDGEVPVMLELWGMQRTLSLSSFSGPLRPRVVVPDRDLSMDQIELNCVLMLNRIVWNRTALTLKLCLH